MIELLAISVLSGILVYRRLTTSQEYDSAAGGRKSSFRVGPRGQKGYVSFRSRDAKRTKKSRRIRKPKTVYASPDLRKPWGW